MLAKVMAKIAAIFRDGKSEEKARGSPCLFREVRKGLKPGAIFAPWLKMEGETKVAIFIVGKAT